METGLKDSVLRCTALWSCCLTNSPALSEQERNSRLKVMGVLVFKKKDPRFNEKFEMKAQLTALNPTCSDAGPANHKCSINIHEMFLVGPIRLIHETSPFTHLYKKSVFQQSINGRPNHVAKMLRICNTCIFETNYRYADKADMSDLRCIGGHGHA